MLKKSLTDEVQKFCHTLEVEDLRRKSDVGQRKIEDRIEENIFKIGKETMKRPKGVLKQQPKGFNNRNGGWKEWNFHIKV